MYVIKRNGNIEEVNFDKIHKRINYIIKEPTLLKNINGAELAQSVIRDLTNNTKTSDIDIYTACKAASLSTNNIEYLTFAGRISINNHHKNTLNSFKDKVALLYRYKSKNGKSRPIVSEALYKFVMKNQNIIDKHVDYNRDYLFDFFGFKTLESGKYLLKIEDKVIERPQDLFMRVAIQIHIPKDQNLYKDKTYMDKILRVYDHMSLRYYTHATPTLYNSCTPRPQLSSCFLMGTEDSTEGIMKTLADCAKISKWSGGIGVHCSNWRSEGAEINGTNGYSSGIIPFLKMYNSCALAFDQGGKRKGSFAIYLEPHHPELMDFLELRKGSGDEDRRCRDLFLALWISDLFVKRMMNDEPWSTFCPYECPGLDTSYGQNYEDLYLKYEREGKAKNTYPAEVILEAIFDAQKESGMPYISYKDTINRTSMQQNLGVIKSSNLCVSGDTMILTINGEISIKELTLSNPVHEIWDGFQFVKAVFKQTGINKDMLEISIKIIINSVVHFTKIKCTPYHKFILIDNSIIEAKDLKRNQSLMYWRHPDTGSYYFSTVIDICELEEKYDTYCFNAEPLHRGIFNGVLLGNCNEINLYSDHKEYAVCNLASICLSQFVEDSYSPEELKEENRRELNHEFPIYPIMNYTRLAEIAAEVAENINNVIDKTWNPVVETARSNFQHRPIGIGIQGLADVFLKFKIPFESKEASIINKKIAEAIYYGALSKSTELCRNIYREAVLTIRDNKEYKTQLFPKEIIKQFPELKKDNVNFTYNNVEDVPKKIGAYSSFEKNGGSHLANGKFHWELYNLKEEDLSGLFDWDALREHIKVYGVRNSLTTAYMPTASTAQIMGCSSCFEPYIANIYKRKVLTGVYIVINKYLMHDLQKSGLWDEAMKNYLLKNNGSIQNIEGIPQYLKDVYKTVWEIKQKTLIDLAADRQPFIDQSQSMNVHYEDFNVDKFATSLIYGWKRGLKTGSYYIRTQPAVMPQKFTIDPDLQPTFMTATDFSNLQEEEEPTCLLCQ